MKNKTKVLNRFRSLLTNPLMEFILIKLVADKPFENVIVKVLPNCYQYKKNTIRRARRDGILYDLDISNLMEWIIYFPIYEPSKTLLFDLIKEGDVVLDIGAHIGEHTLNFAKRVGRNGRVISFEPDTEIYKKCKHNVSLNSFDNIELLNIGLGEEEGEFEIFMVNENNLGMNRIIKDESERLNLNEDCQISRGKILLRTLNSVITERNLEKVDVVKIDVEGFEEHVIKGGFDMLLKYKPVIFIEVADANLKSNGTSAKFLLEEIEKIGYKVIDGDTNNELKFPIKEGEIDLSHNYNMICYPK